MPSLTYNGHIIDQRDSDSYINATQMCQINGKKINDWMRNKETEAYIQGIVRITGFPANDLIITKQGSIENGGGTWVHPKLAIYLGRWISVEFAIWCDEHIKTLIETGKTELAPMSPAEMFLYSAQKMVELEQEQAKLEAEQFRLSQVVTLEAQRTDSIEALVHQHDHELDRIFNSSGHYYTVMGYCSLKNKPVAVSEASKLGREASKLCRQRSIDVVPVADPRFGRVNSYPEHILDAIIS